MKRTPKQPRQQPGELLKLLSAKLPPEALCRNGHGFGIAINDGFVKERLNQVLGPGGWLWEPEPEILACRKWVDAEGKEFCDDKGAPYWEAVAKVTIFISAFNKNYYGQGGFRSTDEGNARKGAITDAFGKALSDLIGVEVYKGELDDEYCMSQKGARAIFLTGVESGFRYCQDGLTVEAALKDARKDWERQSKPKKDEVATELVICGAPEDTSEANRDKTESLDS